MRARVPTPAQLRRTVTLDAAKKPVEYDGSMDSLLKHLQESDEELLERVVYHEDDFLDILGLGDDS